MAEQKTEINTDKVSLFMGLFNVTDDAKGDKLFRGADIKPEPANFSGMQEELSWEIFLVNLVSGPIEF